MSSDQLVHAPEQNHLLCLLTPAEYERLLPLLETVTLRATQVLYEADVPIPYVYFPQTGVYSVIKVMADGRRVEVSMIGKEGMLGVAVFLDAVATPTECLTQITGTAKRLTAEAFRHVARAGGPLYGILQRYAQYVFDQVAQSVACNRLHTLEQRCARWLLMTHDRVETDTFALTQKFLAAMLGVRRAGVTEAEGVLREAGLIRYSRGKVRVLDRAGLEAIACECYATSRGDFHRLLASRNTARAALPTANHGDECVRPA